MNRDGEDELIAALCEVPVADRSLAALHRIGYQTVLPC